MMRPALRLDADQLRAYQSRGFVVVDDMFSPAELVRLDEGAEEQLAGEGERVVRENDRGPVRGVHGSQQVSSVFTALVRHPQLLSVAEQILGDRVYVHQFKINAKAAFDGELWEWHQDSYFWQREDAMPEPRALNVVIHLDEANEFNGPLLLIPGSHTSGDIRTVEAAADGDWRDTVSAKLKYSIERDALRALVSEHGIVAVKVRRGSVLLFHPSVVHGSAANMSPLDRRIVIVSYNAVSNALGDVESPRPEFLASRDFRPLERVPDDALLTA